MGIGDWGLGIGDWGLGIGTNPQSPIPQSQSPTPKFLNDISSKVFVNLKNDIETKKIYIYNDNNDSVLI